MSTLSAIVLAGGNSTRMGTDKALLEINGQPLLQRIYQVAQRVADPVYVVAPWSDRYRTVLPATCRLIAETAFDSDDEQTFPQISHGPMVGFVQGLRQVQTDWVLLLACDLPNLEAEVLQGWAERLPQVSSEAIALLPQHPQGWEPLCGYYRRRCLASLESFLHKSGRSFQRWLSYQTVAPIKDYKRHLLFNCNTPEDLRQTIENDQPEDLRQTIENDQFGLT
ncbi:MAG: molybdenum cofactor guanylyltransferase [Leptolyngbyaceae cyanobacterium SM1_1_3]|nr:molybdenum cofactor guanylyltransferase [Leptolyngbyaceae cyanobacterium SM1_1_3]NJN03195.1 molybdenum cofactor guanylyltransferase [Leptolyngbyaceae cyanobacterium RM1_1_2]NJO08886.1 molybdenum cofactor guanylyltransferase [Leptolyngbyaceae cyanobacterium SL_1_1]